ncbi:MAG: hypothetical protein AB8B52_10600 [Winogradskyella sp.]|uniref:hypothetical protein n=1 Tax=Winogradskyella sp. TaxID=1883156 RepID=UPI00385FD4FE
MSKKPFILNIILFVFLFVIADSALGSFLENGLNKYYGIGESNEIALVGHSHLMLGIDKVQLEVALKKGVSKYTREGVNVNDRLIMIKQLLNNNKNLKTVIYGVDAWTFTGEGLSENSYKLFYPFLDNANIDFYVREHTDRLDYMTKKYIHSSRYNEQLIGGALRGYFKKWDNLKYGKVDTLKLVKTIKNESYRKINSNSVNIKLFKETITLLKQNNINIILLYVPTIDKLQDIQLDDFNKTIEIFENQTDDKVTFVNFQEPWSNRYDLFYDPIHLNPEGQKQITKELITFLKLNN